MWRKKTLITIASIVFKPDPVIDPAQGPSSGFWLGQPDHFWFFFIIQNDVVFLKKIQHVITGFLTGLTGFWTFLIFL